MGMDGWRVVEQGAVRSGEYRYVVDEERPTVGHS